ncbi:MAG: ribonuclease E/G [Bacteroidetes bacterium HGW-Bacteroidetes-6]|jgi:ribonuclease G|nr:MAG: ribonuclease E/G [Bacteroidetes bacterium HGW-Bacteroidetes-6]
MNKELIIDAASGEVQIAFLENKRLVELHTEGGSHDFSVGDFYLGKVKKIISGLNAAFVDVGYEKDAFLHYLDLGPQIRTLNKFVKDINAGKQVSVETYTLDTDIEKTGKITGVLQSGSNILVQIAKEPISTKGPRITTELSLPGRFLVLVPFSKRISISHKIKSLGEKSRLKKIASSLQPFNFGIIVRTVAENKSFDELKADLDELMGRWNGLLVSLRNAKPPFKILGELDRSLTIMRDLLNASYNTIHVNDSTLYSEIRNYLGSIAPEQVDIVKLYKGKTPMFEFMGIDKQIKSSFGKKVTLKSGAYLIIERTEAFHVIDVNSGYKADSGKNQEQNALEANLELAEEVGRQLRLRDLGGIIVVDFIDLHLGSNRRKLYDKLVEEMTNDRAKHTILPPSKFGLVQITRQRVRPETQIEIVEKCPVCSGTGEIKPHTLIIDEIENTLSFLAQEQNEKKLILYVSPFIHAFVTRGFLSNIAKKWRKKLKCSIAVLPASNYHVLEYHIFNKRGEEITL